MPNSFNKFKKVVGALRFPAINHFYQENGDLWYDENDLTFKVKADGVVYDITDTGTGGASGGTLITANGLTVDTLELSGGIPTSLVPDASGVYDLGSENLPFRDLYLTNNSIHLGNNIVSTEDGFLRIDGKNLQTQTVINVKDYGAVGDGVTDDTSAISSAISAAESSTYGGIVYLPPGYYVFSDVIKIKEKEVSLRGAGPRTSVLIPNHANARLQFGPTVAEYNDGAGESPSYLGYIGEFGIDDVDSSISTNPFYVGLVVGARFRDIFVQYSGGNNIEVHLAQNCVFDNVWSQYSYRHNVVLDHGSGGCLWYKCNFNRAGVGTTGQQLHVEESSAVVFGYAQPTDHRFIQCIFERDGGNMDSCVKILDGEKIVFDGCIFSASSAPSGTQLVSLGGGSEVTSYIWFLNSCTFQSGTPGTQTGIDAQEGDIYIDNGVEFRNLLNAFSLSDSTDIFVQGSINYNNVTNQFVNAYGGTSGQTARIRSSVGRIDQVLPSVSDLGLYMAVNGEGNSRLRIAATGQMTWGSGSSAPDTILYRAGANLLGLGSGDSLMVDGNYSAPLRLENGGDRLYLWTDGDNVRIKSTTPASSSDGKILDIASSVNVQRFGATGDGVTDDTQAIKNAISFAESNGYSVLFPSGTYVVSSTININSTINIIGDNSTIHSTISDTFPYAFRFIGSTSSYVYDINFTENFNSSGTVGHFVLLDDDCSGIVFEKCTFNGNVIDVSGIVLSDNCDCSGIKIKDCIFNDCRFAFYSNNTHSVGLKGAYISFNEFNSSMLNFNTPISGWSDIVVTNNTFDFINDANTSVLALAFANCQRITVSFNTIKESGINNFEAIHTENSTSSIVVSYNAIETEGSGIVLDAANTDASEYYGNTNVLGNTIVGTSGSSGTGLWVAWPSALEGVLRDSIISKNIISYFNVGLQSDGSDYSTNITENIIHNCTTAIAGGRIMSNIRDNLLRNCTNAYDVADAILIGHNTLDDCTNILSSTAATGIRFSGITVIKHEIPISGMSAEYIDIGTIKSVSGITALDCYYDESSVPNTYSRGFNRIFNSGSVLYVEPITKSSYGTLVVSGDGWRVESNQLRARFFNGDSDNRTFTASVTIQGELILKDTADVTSYASSDSQDKTITGDWTFSSGLTVGDSIVPDTSGTFDLGSASTPFRDLYLTNNSLHLGDTTLSSTNGNLKVNNKDVVSRTQVDSGTVNFYVAVAGDDSTGDGSEANPWYSINHALDEIDKNYDIVGVARANVNVSGGTYQLQETIELSRKNGQNTYIIGPNLFDPSEATLTWAPSASGFTSTVFSGSGKTVKEINGLTFNVTGDNGSSKLLDLGDGANLFMYSVHYISDGLGNEEIDVYGEGTVLKLGSSSFLGATIDITPRNVGNRRISAIYVNNGAVLDTNGLNITINNGDGSADLASASYGIFANEKSTVKAGSIDIIMDVGGHCIDLNDSEATVTTSNLSGGNSTYNVGIRGRFNSSMYLSSTTVENCDTGILLEYHSNGIGRNMTFTSCDTDTEPTATTSEAASPTYGNYGSYLYLYTI